jgi:hypothetical protein
MKNIEISNLDKQLKVSTNFSKENNLWINPTSVKRILSNLLNNSIQASAKGDVEITINLITHESSIVLSIQDNCGGFDEKTLQLLNSGSEVSTKSLGHGIGLSSLREYIESLGGKTIFSNQGKSAHIEIILPRKFDSTNSSITLIDDDKYIRYAWEQDAKAKDYKINSYSTYADFLKSVDFIERDSEIFIDSDLKHDNRGEDLIEDIFKLGFYKVSIETGKNPEEFKNIKNINNVISKKFPY